MIFYFFKRDGYIRYFVEDCAEWFIYKLLELETSIKSYFETGIELKLDTIPQKLDSADKGWFREKQIGKKVVVTEAFSPIRDTSFSKTVFEDHCQLTGRFRGLAHNECNLNAREPHSLFVPLLFHNFSGFYCQLVFEKLVNMAFENSITIKGEFFIANHQKSINL